jgi:hypothetical protein
VNLLDALAHAREHAEECRAILANGPTLADTEHGRMAQVLGCEGQNVRAS